ncbi:UNVERIFIED_CONTAM: hypothetical protein HDU68_003560 [Siphonaria sp. JEL0065]|nr:hypothetical protein HDU68_003560 [Siphonaria sp. JEL0065]
MSCDQYFASSPAEQPMDPEARRRMFTEARKRRKAGLVLPGGDPPSVASASCSAQEQQPALTTSTSSTTRATASTTTTIDLTNEASESEDDNPEEGGSDTDSDVVFVGSTRPIQPLRVVPNQIQQRPFAHLDDQSLVSQLLRFLPQSHVLSPQPLHQHAQPRYLPYPYSKPTKPREPEPGIP